MWGQGFPEWLGIGFLWLDSGASSRTGGFKTLTLVLGSSQDQGVFPWTCWPCTICFINFCLALGLHLQDLHMVGSCSIMQPHPQSCHYCKEWETETGSGSDVTKSKPVCTASEPARWCHSVRLLCLRRHEQNSFSSRMQSTNEKNEEMTVARAAC